MREIKFRFWDKQDKKFITWPENVYIAGDGKIYTYVNIEIDLEEKELIPVQYTGLKDKNGVEIYEGCVVRYCRKKYTVEWEVPECHFVLVPRLEEDVGYTFDRAELTGQEVGVIGNIHENPGLVSNVLDKEENR